MKDATDVSNFDNYDDEKLPVDHFPFTSSQLFLRMKATGGLILVKFIENSQLASKVKDLIVLL